MNSLTTAFESLNALSVLQSTPPPNPESHAISEIRAFAVPSRGNEDAYSVLKVDTRSGVTGYGECKPLSREDVAALKRLVGKPAYSYEALTPMAPPPAQGGLNMALLDIVGKIANAPVYRVMGGPTRFEARAISRLTGSSDNDLHASLQKQLAAGVRAFLVPVDAPTARNQGSAYVEANLDRFKALRAAAPDADFAVESRDELTPGDAASLAAALEPHHPLWFDEPCPVTNLELLHKVSDQTVVPLGFGRNIRNPGTFQDLLREGVIDLVRPDLLVYGISGVCRIASMAETYYTAMAPWHSAGPISTAAALHAAASMPNFFILQIPDSGPGSTIIRDGFFELPKGPGLGITVDTSQWERSRIG
jgi:galactonate dehydratase